MNVVRESALGAVEVAESMDLLLAAEATAGAEPPADLAEPVPPAPMPARYVKRAQAPAAASFAAGAASAEMAQADVSEVGDFAIFESQTPVTIPANRSAIVPVFTRQVGDAKVPGEVLPELEQEEEAQLAEFRELIRKSNG